MTCKDQIITLLCLNLYQDLKINTLCACSQIPT